MTRPKLSPREIVQRLQMIDALNAARRVDEIRVFHSLDYMGKRDRILALMGRRPE